MNAEARPEIASINPIRAVLQLVAGWTFTLFFTTSVVLISIVTLGRFAYTVTPMMLRFWGRGALWIQGVKLHVEGLENYATPTARVALFNHTSSLDAMIIPAIIPPGSTVAIKREVLFVPFVGMACVVLGFLFVNRGKSEKARRTLAKATARMQRKKLTVFIAPEGTRSHDGELQPFKRGAFHLAQASGAVISPVVISGAYALHPRDRIAARQGTIYIRILPGIPTADLAPEDVGAFADRLHDVYAAELATMGPKA
ncbi:MAG: 1-acyl-sn-glycerol-3-phosphate acyltransferase [Bradymonadia bacterium]|jgi:1-acyl-sn-glycerol-3-phosphate acyltransferase